MVRLIFHSYFAMNNWKSNINVVYVFMVNGTFFFLKKIWLKCHRISDNKQAFRLYQKLVLSNRIDFKINSTQNSQWSQRKLKITFRLPLNIRCIQNIPNTNIASHVHQSHCIKICKHCEWLMHTFRVTHYRQLAFLYNIFNTSHNIWWTWSILRLVRTT